MSWNYRLIHHDTPHVEVPPEDWYAIHEIFYNENNKIILRSVEPVTVEGETKEEILNNLKKMTEAVLQHPILKLSELEKSADRGNKNET